MWINFFQMNTKSVYVIYLCICIFSCFCYRLFWLVYILVFFFSWFFFFMRKKKTNYKELIGSIDRSYAFSLAISKPLLALSKKMITLTCGKDVSCCVHLPYILDMSQHFQSSVFIISWYVLNLLANFLRLLLDYIIVPP